MAASASTGLPDLPEGLEVYENVITPEQERILLREIDSLPWDTSLQRRVQHYGTWYDYVSKSGGSAAPDMPRNMNFIGNWLYSKGYFDREPDQAIVNEYNRKTGIAEHTDRNIFGPTIVGLNLGDSVVMNFSRPGYETVEVYLPARSMMVMSGEARSEWKHGIKPNVTYYVDGVKHTKPQDYRRVSITYRTML